VTSRRTETPGGNVARDVVLFADGEALAGGGVEPSGADVKGDPLGADAAALAATAGSSGALPMKAVAAVIAAAAITAIAEIHATLTVSGRVARRVVPLPSDITSPRRNRQLGPRTQECSTARTVPAQAIVGLRTWHGLHGVS
jgi:hypothetical protein